ncbi:putative transcriptional repressor in the Rok (NagC/XylR) family protein [Firmicutes bacterium CAG:791]|nr:putative transcriptional repressor in the Rok (NagC/XylR) family protein [Firmicutes bacterium CAG:791]
MKSGKNLADLINENKSHILRYLIHHEGVSRIELSAATGLQPASITKIIQQLIEQELVVETGLSDGSKGRRSISLSFNYRKYSVIAIKLNWSRLKIDLMDFKGNSQEELFSIQFPSLYFERMDEIVSLIAQKVNEIHSRHDNIVAVGVASFGPLLYESGDILFEPQNTQEHRNEEHCYSYPLLSRLRSQIQIPVFVELEAVAGALAYWWFQTNCNPTQKLMHIFAGEGIGGGLIINGHRLSDFLDNAFEFGHIIINANGDKCSSGCTGCLQTYCSFTSLVHHAQTRLNDYPESILFSRRDVLTVYELIDAMNAGDDCAIDTIMDWGFYLGCGIASILPLFAPDIVVISDVMIRCGDPLLNAIERSIQMHKHYAYKTPKLIFAEPDNDLILLGAATVAIDKVLSSPGKYFASTVSV